jgi:hypothetical protein
MCPASVGSDRQLAHESRRAETRAERDDEPCAVRPRLARMDGHEIIGAEQRQRQRQRLDIVENEELGDAEMPGKRDAGEHPAAIGHADAVALDEPRHGDHRAAELRPAHLLAIGRGCVLEAPIAPRRQHPDLVWLAVVAGERKAHMGAAGIDEQDRTVCFRHGASL